ncbi:MAG: histidine--tRNA ligase [Candidatus Levybacteria bacterium CG_4_10_14_0_2_um_filter_36_16]|nr:MAG: histidine--tRNA ligase [Candidatus Levybacteria bacterium CG10_big_fil_rev_8_21_14_0_10_36_30]PIZ97952.1 MAG: histidine--tRNA ligase [Candidatus Levybacteria bacterium CG_4_10_14_0_2_um_filter_36_16]
MIKNMIQPRTLKGFRDFLPKEVRKRNYVIETLKRVFESYGFEPLETPSLEYEDILLGKYGEEGDKLMYRFEDNGGRRVALRYDQTVPLARVVAQYQNDLPLPFKRYQISNVWRAENTQKGRYREFLQCDADIIGTSSVIADAELLGLVIDIYKELKLDVIIKINDRANFESLDKKYVSVIDKLEKLGESTVLSEMIEKGMSDADARSTLKSLQDKPMTENLKQVLDVLESMGKDTSKVQYEPTLARGLDYYTGMIFETIAQNSAGSICSGGRWDKMIGLFTGQNQPAVGFGLGFDRTVEVLEEQNLLPKKFATTQVLVSIPSNKLKQTTLKITSMLRSKNINAETWLDESKLEKQFKYAEKKEIPYVVVPIDDKTVELRTKSQAPSRSATGQAGEIVKKIVELNSLPNEIK